MLNIYTKVYFDEDVVKKNSKKILSYGKRPLIVTGHSSEKNGSLDDIKNILNDSNIPFDIFNEVEENPSVETVMKGRNFGLKEKCDFVIAIGGGSILDAAKAISIMMANVNKTEDFLYDNTKTSKNLPIVAIPTTCGSGAEVTGNAVLTLHKNQTKQSALHKAFPEIALIDGKYILNTPINLIKRTALDALAHMIESFVNVKANEYTKQIALNAMSLWKKTKNYLIGKEELTKDICDRLMMSSCYAGVCISNTGTSIPHRLSYRITYGDNISHGLAVAYFLVNFLDECGDKDKKEVLDKIGFNDIKEFKVFVNDILGNIVVDKNLIIKGVDEILQNEAILKSVKFNVNKNVLLKIAGV